MACDQALNNRITAIIAAWEGVEVKKMFGGVCHLLHGNMFACVYR
jgi:TfoX/Sxy family transcriptional regulator of competence genes